MSSSFGCIDTPSVPVTILEYQDMADSPHGGTTQKVGGGFFQKEAGAAEERSPEIELNAKIAQVRAEAVRETEERLRQMYEEKLLAEKMQITAAIAGFAEHRSEYFTRVESEVVQLALAIAKKILHREAQVDPMLVAALVRMAIEKLHDGTSVTIRVSPHQVASWKVYFAGQSLAARAQVIGDAELNDQDCLLETELGTANFGLNAQLKEVEQGFFDLLALRPVNR